MSNSKLSSELVLTLTNWPTFRNAFLMKIQEENGLVAVFMLSGLLPSNHPFNVSCLYVSTAANAVQVGNPLDVWKDRNGKDTNARVKVNNSEEARACLLAESQFTNECVKVAGKLYNCMVQAVRDHVQLIPDWITWSLTGRVDIMFDRLDKVYLTESTAVSAPRAYSLRINLLMKAYLANVQGEKLLATYTTEQNQIIEKMVNAGLPIKEKFVEVMLSVAFVHNLNQTFKEDIARAEDKDAFNPNTLTWVATQKMVSEWYANRAQLDAILLNNGTPVSNTTAASTNVSDKKKNKNNKKKNKSQANNNSNNNNNANNNNAANTNQEVLSCRLCGYKCGHKTADCTKCSGAVKETLLKTEQDYTAHAKASKGKKKKQNQSA